MVFIRKNVNRNDYIHSCVIGCHSNSLLHLELNTKVNSEGLLGGMEIILKHLYLKDYAEFDSKISYIMFQHDYHLACEISMVRTFSLNVIQKWTTANTD